MPADLPAPWPYPRWIAHRGAGRQAPENTLAALRLGAACGYRMFECDVKLSRDDLPFLLHDATLERTTDGQGVAGEQDWAVLARLDAGRWHAPRHAAEPLPTLASVAAFCLAQDCLLNIEIKPTPGSEHHTGRIVAAAAARLWRGHTAPLLTSFAREALEGAREAAPQLPRGLLLETLAPAWVEAAQALACVAVVVQHRQWNRATVDQAHRAGLRCLAYTVNEAAEAQRLLELGLDGIITDEVHRFDPRRVDRVAVNPGPVHDVSN